MISRRNLPDLLFLTGAVSATRFLFRSHLLYDLDSVDFALGMRHFAPQVYQPHPPGYFLYICLGRLLNTVFHDPNLALVVLSILASCGLVLVIYQMTLEWFGQRAARFAGTLFLFSPLAWFHGTVALTYIVGAFFSALLGYLCWHVYRGRSSFILPASIILGISAGVRPSSFLFLMPLFLLSLRRTTLGGKVLASAALLLALAAWFVPMVVVSGGPKAYFGALFMLWHMVPGKTTAFNSSPATSIARALTIVFIYVLIFGAASIAPWAAKLRRTPADPGKKWFTLVWITPALCFFTFIFLKFVNSGYLLLLVAPASLWLGFWISEWYEHASLGKPFKLALIVLCAAVNTLIFLDSPLYCSYRQVRQFEAELRSIQASLPQVGPPGNTLIVSFDSHFLGFRHAGYYLPSYLNVEYPEVKLSTCARVFAMQGRDTHLLEKLPAASYSRFVLFPLPGNADRYPEYLKKVEDKLPARSLQTIRLNGHTFVTGPMKDLPFLFPLVDPRPPNTP
jgi:hypothetical protein